MPQLRHCRPQTTEFIAARLVWNELAAEKASPETAPDDPEITIRRLAELRRDIEAQHAKADEAKDESGIQRMEEEFDQSKAKLAELLQREHVRDQLRKSADLSRLIMLDEIMPGSLAALYCRENGQAQFGEGKSFVVDMPENSLADAALGLGMIDFRQEGKGAHPPFVMVKKPDGTVQFGQRGIREYARRGSQTTERVGYYDIAGGDYLEIHSGYQFETYTDQAQLQKAYAAFNADQPKDAQKPLDAEALAKSPPASPWRERAANEGYAAHIRDRKERGDQVMIRLNEIPANEVAEYLMRMPWEEMHDLRYALSENGANIKYGPQVTRFLREKGVDPSVTMATELSQALDRVAESPDANAEALIDALGGKEAFKETLTKLAGHESRYQPFAVSATGCIGLFQFNRGNARKYQINPLNTTEAVRGVIALMAENLADLQRNGYGNSPDLAKRLLVAHNRGLGVAVAADLSHVGRDQYGNPTALAYVQQVMNTNIPKVAAKKEPDAAA